MSKKRPQEESQNEEDQQDETQKYSSANEDDGNQQDKKFECICGKSYPLQSSLFNHIRIKHEDKKEEYAVPRNVKPGRPKNTEIKDKGDKKNSQKKEKKPEGVDENTWETIQLYKNPLFNDLIIEFKDKMRDNSQQDQDKENETWKEYEKKRDELFSKINFPKADRLEIQQKTNFLLQAWGKLLKLDSQIQIYFAFVCQYILNYYNNNLSDKNKDIILKEMRISGSLESGNKISQIFQKNFKEENVPQQSQNSQQIQQQHQNRNQQVDYQEQQHQEPQLEYQQDINPQQQQEQQHQQQENQFSFQYAQSHQLQNNYEEQKVDFQFPQNNTETNNNQIYNNYQEQPNQYNNQQYEQFNQDAINYGNGINNNHNNNDFTNNNEGKFAYDQIMGQLDGLNDYDNQDNQDNQVMLPFTQSFFNNQSFNNPSFRMINQISQNKFPLQNVNFQQIFDYNQTQEEEYFENDEEEINENSYQNDN